MKISEVCIKFEVLEVDYDIILSLSRFQFLLCSCYNLSQSDEAIFSSISKIAETDHLMPNIIKPRLLKSFLDMGGQSLFYFLAFFLMILFLRHHVASFYNLFERLYTSNQFSLRKEKYRLVVCRRLRCCSSVPLFRHTSYQSRTSVAA